MREGDKSDGFGGNAPVHYVYPLSSIIISEDKAVCSRVGGWGEWWG